MFVKAAEMLTLDQVVKDAKNPILKQELLP